ncbi:hypothetical protein FZEAL_10894, partial [Fusarium zealandicum]
MEQNNQTKDSLSPPTRHQQYDEATDQGTHKASRSPSFSRDTQLSSLSEENESSYFMTIEEEMKHEKERYPGASSWAPAEERLFEILFMRQDLPMLPSTWDVDLRGVPISDVIFKTSDDFPPIVYAHSKHFRATMALTRLIDLTAKARTSIQSGLRTKVSQLIKREMDKYLSWAAQDADYAHLRIVPNIMTEVIDTTMPEDTITEYIQNRMRSLAKLQREFLREDRNPQFWDILKPSIMSSPMIKIEPDDDSSSSSLGKWSKPIKRRRDPFIHVDELSSETPTRDRAVKVEPELKRLRLYRGPNGVDVDELIQFHEEGRKDSRRKSEVRIKEIEQTIMVQGEGSSPASTSSSPRSPSPPSPPAEPTR